MSNKDTIILKIRKDDKKKNNLVNDSQPNKEDREENKNEDCLNQEDEIENQISDFSSPLQLNIQSYTPSLTQDKNSRMNYEEDN